MDTHTSALPGVGETNPIMGTTTQGETYSLKLRGIGREILIIDTPGILEAGIAGTEREDEFVKSFVQDGGTVRR